MKKKGLFIIALSLTTIFLLGCQKPATPAPETIPPAEQKAADPLAEARTKLYQEIGLDQKGSAPSAKPEAPLPVVSPNPPELPKTDANISE